MTKLLSSIVLFLSLSSLTHANGPTQVYIEGDDVGQGFSVKRLNLCYFIAPHHVIQDSIFLTVKGSDVLRSLGDGQSLQPFGYDLSVGHISGSLSKRCGIEFDTLSVKQASIDKAKTVVVSTVNSDGLISRTPAVVQETGLVYLSIKPLSDEKAFFKGMSGSLVFSQGHPIGMLQSVESDSGLGKVLRLDRLLETVAPFFSSSQKMSKPSTSHKESASDNLLYDITHWNLPPTNNELSVQLLSDGNNETFYQTKLNGKVAELDFTLPDYKNLKSIKLTLPVNSGIKDIEILTSKKKTGKRGWVSSASNTVLPKQTEVTVELGGTKARRVKLKVYSSWNSEGHLRLSEVSLF